MEENIVQAPERHVGNKERKTCISPERIYHTYGIYTYTPPSLLSRINPILFIYKYDTSHI